MPNTQSSSTQQVQPQFTFEGGHLVMFHQEQTGLPQTRDANVNDRDRMYDLIQQEKSLTTEYHTAMLEAADDQLFQTFKQCHDNCHQVQRQLWNTAFKKGWYRVPVAEAQAIVAAFTKFQQSMQEFPFQANQQLKSQGANFPTTDGQWPQVGVTANNVTATAAYAGTAAKAGQTASTTASAQSASASSSADQKLQQVVSQALKDAQQGKVPTGYRAH